MSKKTIMAATITSALLIMVLVLAFQVSFVVSNPIGMDKPWDPKPIITIVSPQNQSKINTNNLATDTTVTLMFIVDLSQWYNYYTPFNPTYTFILKPIEYCLYSNLRGQYYSWSNLGGQIVGNVTKDPYTISVPLTVISEGQYYVEVIAKTSGKYWNASYNERHELVAKAVDGETVGSSGKIYFTVNVPPKVTLTSIENKTYFGSEVALTFLVDKPYSRFTLSLDDQVNRTIWENTTLTNLQVGSHSVKVYSTAWDDPENVGASETVTFIIAAPATPTPSQSPQPTPTKTPTPTPTILPTPTQQPSPSASDLASPTPNNPDWQLGTYWVAAALVAVAIAVLATVMLKRRSQIRLHGS